MKIEIDSISIIYDSKIYDMSDYREFLRKHIGVYDNFRKIAVKMERSPELLFTFLMLLDKEITYIPIDPMYPQERIDYICADSDADCLISDSGVEIKKKDYHKTRNDIAYILYTSGSTGKPKGVEITRDSLTNFIEGVSEIIDFSPMKRIACFTSVSFDIFFLESIMALYKGLTVILANKNEQRNPKQMAKLINDNAIDIIQMTPSGMQLLLSYDVELLCLKKVKEILIGGEPFPFNLLRTLQTKTTAKIYNMYGPTETTIWSTISDLTDKNRIDIGRPIKNTEIFIVDNKLNILAEEQVGEICIAGKGLAKGYVGRKDLTNEKFISLPSKPNVRIYRTGDMGKYLPDGDIAYLGRTDNQVKVHGYRIELEEIEANLCRYDGIGNAVVIVTGVGDKNSILEVFYTSKTNIETQSLISFLSLRLPEYMVPMVYRQVNDFIYTANGKIDRKRISECVIIGGEQKVSLEKIEVQFDIDSIQKKSLAIITSYIDTNNITENFLDVDFASMGIDSVTFVKIVIDLENEFEFEFDIEMLNATAFSTIKLMTEYVKSQVELKQKIL